ncbi:MAG: hypothetical protein H7067_13560 [Burkholderiales bacterium]|nr:hypothetical protein [Opitutaceae bacterium]
MNPPRYLIALVSGWGLALSSASASADLTTLTARSPFMPAGGAGASGNVAEPGATLEFRGVVMEPRGMYFSVFDATANRGYWLLEGASDGAMRVARYDRESGALEIEQNGRAVKLALKQASTASSAKPIITAAAHATGVPGLHHRARPTTDQSERMARIAKEVRDRRALRLAAQAGARQPGASTTATSSPGL